MTRSQPLGLPTPARTIEVRTHGRYLIDLRAGAVATLVGFHGYQETAAIHLEVLRRQLPTEEIMKTAQTSLHPAPQNCQRIFSLR